MQLRKTIARYATWTSYLLFIAFICALIAVDWQPLLGDLFSFFQTQQRAFHDRLATNMRDLQQGYSFAAVGALMAVGFLYGVFHAAGPGHGKLIVAGYMLSTRDSLKRGILVAVLSALMQALMAIFLVITLFYLLGFARSETEHAALILEAVSFGLVAFIGFMLLRRGLREARNMKNAAHAAKHEHRHGHDHHHDHACGCRHAHMPSAAALADKKGFWQLALMSISIGLRPCSGAIILLLFACMIGAVTAGIAATFAMAIGTALTTSFLAIAAVQSRNFVLNRLSQHDKKIEIAHAALAIGGGILIMLLGLLFMLASIDMAKSFADAPSQQTPGLMNLPRR